MPAANRKEEQEAFEESDESDDLDCAERRPEGGLPDDICKQHISKVSINTMSMKKHVHNRESKAHDEQAPSVASRLTHL